MLGKNILLINEIQRNNLNRFKTRIDKGYRERMYNPYQQQYGYTGYRKS